MLEERCAEETLQALAQEKMTLAEIALEEYSRCTPEPNSKEEVRLWANTLTSWYKFEIFLLDSDVVKHA